MSAPSTVARMLTLVPWLLERPGASVAETAEAFGVEPAQIRRDLGHLDFCGLPGLGGGDLFDVSLVGDRIVVSMADELRRPLKPTANEALRLVLTVDAVADALGEELPVLRSAIAKIRDTLGIPADVADVLADPQPPALPPIRQALAEAKQVALTYQSRADTQPAPRLVEPWALHLLDGVWYLQGLDVQRQDQRTYRLDRVAQATVTDEPAAAEAPPHLPPPQYVQGSDDLEVVLELEASARWIEGAMTVDSVEERPDGGAVVTLHTDAPRWVARLVLMGGGAVVVKAPSSLAAEVYELASEALAHHTDRPR